MLAVNRTSESVARRGELEGCTSSTTEGSSCDHGTELVLDASATRFAARAVPVPA